MSTRAERPRRARGRPSRSAGMALTREAIVRTALEVAGAEGFVALTMHRLARELEVTPRALYNHVRDRQEVVDDVAALMMRELPEPELDPTDWQTSLRAAYREARDAYRRYPRAILISLDETVTPGKVDPRRFLLAENMLRFFIDVGLTLEQAIAVRGAFLVDVFGFVLTIDYRYDSGDQAMREAIPQPVPAAWLTAHPDVPAPLAREAAALPPTSSEEMFEAFVDLRVSAIEVLLAERSQRGR